MYCNVKELDGYVLAARDGEIGHVRDVYFDDQHWVIRHLVVDTGGWLSGRKVLISPHSIGGIDPLARQVPVGLSREQVKSAPGIDTDKPVSRQHEIPYYDHYGYPYYWAGGGLWGVEAYPMAGEALAPRRSPSMSREVAAEIAVAEFEAADTHLRSSNDVVGYDVQASDGAIGHIADFLFDDRSWQIRYLVVDTRNWLPGRLVLVRPQSVASIDWPNRRTHFRVTREVVETSPPYDHTAPLSEDDERHMQRHYAGW